MKRQRSFKQMAMRIAVMVLIWWCAWSFNCVHAAGVAPPAGLVAWWAGDGTADDLVGGNHGVIHDTGFVPGMVGEGFRFDGVNSYVVVSDSPSLRFTNELTVELWFLGDEWRWDTSYPLVDKRAWDGCNYGALLSPNWGFQLYYDDPLVDEGGKFEISGCFPLPTPGVFHHFAGTYRQADAAHIELQTFVDGQLVKTAVLPGNLANTLNSTPLTIGSERGGVGDFFKGVIDEVCLYNRILTPAEIQGVYDAGSSGKVKPELPPVIVAQPQDRQATIGGNVTFSVRASGTAPLNYQWSFNGQPLAGSMSSVLVLSNAQPTQAGLYSVVVSNALGTVASREATLTVSTGGSLIVPSNLADTDGHGGSSVLQSAIRLQEVYQASQFSTGPILIQAIRFRPSAIYGQAFSETISNLQINMSATPIQPGGMSRDFAANIGPDDTVVFHGAIQLSSDCAGLDGSPKAFDIVIPLSVPFLYDPSAGNLLVDFRNFSGSLVTHVDAGAAHGSASRVFALGAGSTRATTSDDGADVLEITYTAAERTPPTITRQPQDQRVGVGEQATFTVAASGSHPLSYQWRFNGALIENATNSTLLLSNVQLAQSGEYSVIVANDIGSATSTNAVLTVVVLPPTITRQPQDQNVAVGRLATFTVGASSTSPLTYQWRFNDTPIEGATNSTLLLSNVQPTHAGNYSVVVANEIASVTSSIAVLSVDLNPNLIVPDVWANTGGGGGSSVLRHSIRLQEVYSASQFPPRPILIQELRFRPNAAYGQPFSETIAHLQINLSATTVQPGSLSSTFANNPGANDTVVFAGSISLSSACLGPVNGPKEFDIVIPLTTPFLYDPSVGNLLVDFHNFSGSLVTYVDAGSASGTASRVFALGGGSTHATSSDNGADVLEIIFTAAQPAAPTITHQPQDQNVGVGRQATFNVAASGSGVLSYQWRFNDTPLEGATNSTLLLSNVQPSQAGNYSVVVANDIASVTSTNAVLTIDLNPILIVPDVLANTDGHGGSSVLRHSIRLQEVYSAAQFPPQPILITELRFRPSAAYGQPFSETISNLQINLSTTLVQPDGLSATFANNPGTNDTVVFAGSISLSSACLGPAGGPKEFDIVIPLMVPFLYDPSAGNLLVDFRNFSGSLVTYVDAGAANGRASRVFALGGNSAVATSGDNGADVIRIAHTLGEPVGPVILKQPEDLVVSVGSEAVLSVQSGGTAPLFYQWSFNGEPLAGATSASLVLANVQMSQAGVYSVVVSNQVGVAVSAKATLRVQEPVPVAPVIVLQPANRSVAVGATVSFSVIATGTPPLSVQWFRNGQAIPDATNFLLELTNVQASLAGTYRAAVTNDQGAAFSSGAVLNVESWVGGTVSFMNYAGTNSAWIYDVDCSTRLAGPAYLAQLYAGPDESSMTAIGAAAPFGSGLQVGLFNGGIRYISTVAPTGLATVQVKAWDSASGSTYEQAQTAGGKAGASPIFTVRTGGGLMPPSRLVGLEGFCLSVTSAPPQVAAAKLVARPAAPAVLTALGSPRDKGFRFTLQGDAGATYRVEVSPDLLNWRTLTNIFSTGSDPVIDPDAPGAPHLFYRARNQE
ncbi:MAG: immunoglobulin domain-containing protein [Verrucomicrobia bacterium]|nr:immunoglobulin domain-containing protein [Verrucomicrobiota bacterium]